MDNSFFNPEIDPDVIQRLLNSMTVKTVEALKRGEPDYLLKLRRTTGSGESEETSLCTAGDWANFIIRGVDPV